MKHRNLTMLLLVTVTAFVLVGCSLAYADDSVPAGSPSTPPSYCSEEEALAAALAHAGVSAGEVSGKRIEFDYDDAVAEYEIEFLVGTVEYDYHIHAQTGAVLGWSQEPEEALPKEALISQTDAQNIALSHAGVTRDQVTRLRSSQDWDDGRPEYEVEFYVGRTEYEYEIHGQTGEILSWDRDTD